jgi:hypothetical protein
VDLGEIVWGDMDWINLVEDRDWWQAFINMAMNCGVPNNVVKFQSS